MFNISFSEIFIILLVVILFFKPDEIPSIMKNIKTFIDKIIALKNDFLESFNNEISEIEEDLKNNNKIIPDDER